MTRPLHLLAVGTAAVLVAAACAKVPYTNRSQFNLVPEGTMNAMGKEAYDEILSQSTVRSSGGDVDTLQRVGRRISKVANEPDYAWSFAMIQDAQVNAWCLPGGYIGFYDGILPVLANESGMAFVMGHEVGHAVAHHSGERLSQQLGVAGALSIVDLFLSGSGKVGEQERGMVLGALGIAGELGVLLPYSRTHEKEADVIGMMYMAEAGYPPKQSLSVWERMSAVAGDAPLPFLSTHPSNEARIANQSEWMPEARKKYLRNKRDADGDLTATIWR